MDILKTIHSENLETQRGTLGDGSIPKRLKEIYQIGEEMRNPGQNERVKSVVEVKDLIKQAKEILALLDKENYSNPGVIQLNDRLSDLEFDVEDASPLVVAEFKGIATNILQEVYRLGLSGKFDPDFKSSKDLFSYTLTNIADNRKDAIRKLNRMDVQKITPQFTYGIFNIGIECDLDDVEGKEVKVTLGYPFPDEESGDYGIKYFTFYLSKDGLAFGEKGFDKVTLPKELSFVKLSEVLFDVSLGLDFLTKDPYTEITRSVNRKSLTPEKNEPQKESPSKERNPHALDPAREQIMDDSARENDINKIGVIQVRTVLDFYEKENGDKAKDVAPYQKFRYYRVALYDNGFAVYTLKVGNATYFVHYNEKLSNEECEKLRDHITKHIPGDESKAADQEEVIKFLEREVNDLFFDENVTKAEIIEKVPNVTRIVHAGKWGEKVKGLFTSEPGEEINKTDK